MNGRRREIGGDVPKMDAVDVFNWLDSLKGTPAAAAAAEAQDAILDLFTGRRRRRCGRLAPADHVAVLKGFLQ